MCKTDVKAKKVEPTFTQGELARREDLIAIYDSVYNLAGLAKEHPGGEMILSAGASDVTALFHSMHMGVEAANSKLLQSFRVGAYEAPKNEPYYVFNSEFAQETSKTLKNEIKKAGYTTLYGPLGFLMRTMLICIGTLFCEYMWAATGFLSWGVGVGLMHAWIGLAVQHDASHGAFSRDSAVNAFFSYGADWIGNSRWIWLQQHILLHHCFTNHEGKDLDAHSAEPTLLFHPYSSTKSEPARPSPRAWYHKFQGFYMYLVLSMYGPSVVYNFGYFAKGLKHSELYPENKWMQRRLPFAMVLRVFYFLRVVIAPLYFSSPPLLAALFLPSYVAGCVLTFFFVLSHNFMGSDREPVEHSRIGTTADGRPIVDWYKAQVETSSTYGGYTAMFFTGGLNFQIEHHLFPRVSSWYYPLVRKSIQKVCEKHNVQYTYFPTLHSNIVSTIKYMHKVGVEGLKMD